MICALLLSPLVLVCQAEPAPPSVIADLRQVCEAVTKLDSYSFEYLSDGGNPFGRGGFGRGDSRGGRAGGQAGSGGQGVEPPKPEPVKPWIVTWQQGQPTMIQQGEFQAARLGDVTIYRVAEGKWQRVEMSQPGVGSRRGGGRERGGGQGNQRGERPERPAGMMQVFQIQGMVLPHEALAQLADLVQVDQVKASTKLGLKVFEGPLTADGAAKMGRQGRGFGRGGGPEIKTTGKFRLLIDTAGAVREFSLETTLSGTFRDRDFERTSKRSFKMSKHGASKVEIETKLRDLLKPTVAAGEEF